MRFVRTLFWEGLWHQTSKVEEELSTNCHLRNALRLRMETIWVFNLVGFSFNLWRVLLCGEYEIVIKFSVWDREGVSNYMSSKRTDSDLWFIFPSSSKPQATGSISPLNSIPISFQRKIYVKAFNGVTSSISPNHKADHGKERHMKRWKFKYFQSSFRVTAKSWTNDFL